MVDVMGVVRDAQAEYAWEQNEGRTVTALSWVGVDARQRPAIAVAVNRRALEVQVPLLVPRVLLRLMCPQMRHFCCRENVSQVKLLGRN